MDEITTNNKGKVPFHLVGTWKDSDIVTWVLIQAAFRGLEIVQELQDVLVDEIEFFGQLI